MRQQIASINEEKKIAVSKIEMLVQENEGLKIKVNQLSCIEEELLQKSSPGWYLFKNSDLNFFSNLFKIIKCYCVRFR